MDLDSKRARKLDRLLTADGWPIFEACCLACGITKDPREIGGKMAQEYRDRKVGELIDKAVLAIKAGVLAGRLPEGRRDPFRFNTYSPRSDFLEWATKHVELPALLAELRVDTGGEAQSVTNEPSEVKPGIVHIQEFHPFPREAFRPGEAFAVILHGDEGGTISFAKQEPPYDPISVEEVGEDRATEICRIIEVNRGYFQSAMQNKIKGMGEERALWSLRDAIEQLFFRHAFCEVDDEQRKARDVALEQTFKTALASHAAGELTLKFAGAEPFVRPFDLIQWIAGPVGNSTYTCCEPERLLAFRRIVAEQEGDCTAKLSSEGQLAKEPNSGKAYAQQRWTVPVRLDVGGRRFTKVLLGPSPEWPLAFADEDGLIGGPYEDPELLAAARNAWIGLLNVTMRNIQSTIAEYDAERLLPLAEALQILCGSDDVDAAEGAYRRGNLNAEESGNKIWVLLADLADWAVYSNTAQIFKDPLRQYVVTLLHSRGEIPRAEISGGESCEANETTKEGISQIIPGEAVVIVLNYLYQYQGEWIRAKQVKDNCPGNRDYPDPSTVQRLLKKLLKHGLVEQNRNKHYRILEAGTNALRVDKII